MLDTLNDAANVLEAIADRNGQYLDIADEYGEPGYEGSLVVLGYYWCRCDRIGEPDTYGRYLHDVFAHYPAIAARLAELDVQLEWSDEWRNVDGKAYRTTGDSYHWQPSCILTEDGEPLTIDDDFSEIVEWALNDSSRCIPANFATTGDLIESGFAQYEYDGAPAYESGWHPGQTDDPGTVTEQIHAALGEDTDIVFYLDETSQFYMRFTAWTRKRSDDDE